MFNISNPLVSADCWSRPTGNGPSGYGPLEARIPRSPFFCSLSMFLPFLLFIPNKHLHLMPLERIIFPSFRIPSFTYSFSQSVLPSFSISTIIHVPYLLISDCSIQLMRVLVQPIKIAGSWMYLTGR